MSFLGRGLCCTVAGFVGLGFAIAEADSALGLTAISLLWLGATNLQLAGDK